MKERSKISKKIFNAILIIESFVLAGMLFIIISDIYSNSFDRNTIVCIVILLCFGIIMPFVLKPFLKVAFEDLEMCKESERYVQQNLSKEYFVEVIPIRDEPQHENFLTKELVKRAKFYAQIMSDGTVMISIKFNNEEYRIYYGEFYAGDFTTYFKVLNS